MTIRHLRIFRAVCNQMSITRAAQELNTTQPAVSLAIRELESYYHTQLFVRSNRRILLTEAGERLRGYAENFIDQFEEIDRIMRDEGGFRRCRFGVNISTGETRLAEMLSAIRRVAPQAELEVYVDNSQAVEEKLARSEIDFAVLDSLSGQAGLTAQMLYADGMAVVCGAELGAPEEIDLTGLSRLPLMLREKGSGNRVSLDAVFEREGIVPRPKVESASDLCLLTLARSGEGVTILPRRLVEADLAQGTLREIRVPNADFSRHFFLVRREKQYQTALAQSIIAALAAGVGE